MPLTIAAIKETAVHEARVAITPETCAKLKALGLEVWIESGAGLASSYRDGDYEAAGARIASLAEVLGAADLLVCVQPKTDAGFLQKLKPGALYIGMFNLLQHPDVASKLAEQNVSSIALELIPRITRAQSMDVLSSQSNLAGYKAVLDALEQSQKVVPMMMTAGGTIKPAKALVLGAGVAGLQAIATAKRLGAIVSAFDVRPAVKEQVQSLGATFIEVPADDTASAETAGGYAREMSEAYKKKQSQLIHNTLKEQDIVITTALIPGRPAPKLITHAMLADMKQGSIIVDLAAPNGGNTEGCVPDEVVRKNGVTIVGYTNTPSRVATDASALYARNILSLITLLYDKAAGAIVLNEEDEIIKGALVTRGGKVVNAQLNGLLGNKAAETQNVKPREEKAPPASVQRENNYVKQKTKEKQKKAEST